MENYGILSLLPVAVVILLVFITRRTAASLLAGSVVGAFMLYGKSFAKPLIDVVYGVMGSELWMNKDYGHRFLDEKVSDYCRYTDELFSVRASVTMNVTLKDGNTRDYSIDQALFFRKKNGNWVCYEMTNEDVTKPVGKVRITFINDGTTLSSEFYDTNATSLMAPVVATPEGKVFTGWVTVDQDESGATVYNLQFQPDEEGKVAIRSIRRWTGWSLWWC